MVDEGWKSFDQNSPPQPGSEVLTKMLGQKHQDELKKRIAEQQQTPESQDAYPVAEKAYTEKDNWCREDMLDFASEHEFPWCTPDDLRYEDGGVLSENFKTEKRRRVVRLLRQRGWHDENVDIEAEEG